MTNIFLPKFNGTSTFAKMTSDFVAPDDYELLVKAALPSGQVHTLLGNQSNTAYYLRLDSSGVMVLNAAYVKVTTTHVFTLDNKEREYGVRLEGIDFIFSQDGVDVETISSIEAAAKTLTIRTAGKSSSNYTSGYITQVELSRVGDLRLFEVDVKTGNSVQQEGNVLSANLVANSDFANGTDDWYSTRANSILSIEGSVLRCAASSTDTFGLGQQVDNLIVGGHYILNYNFSSVPAVANTRIRIAIDADLSTDTYEVGNIPTGAQELSFVASATTMYFGTITTGHAANDYVEMEQGFSVRNSSLPLLQIFGADEINEYALSADETQYEAVDPLVTPQVIEIFGATAVVGDGTTTLTLVDINAAMVDGSYTCDIIETGGTRETVALGVPVVFSNNTAVVDVTLDSGVEVWVLNRGTNPPVQGNTAPFSGFAFIVRSA